MLANVAYNYAAQVVLAISGLLTLPFLLARMGAELYAFVAIYFTIQTIFSILDGGLSGSLAREFALRRLAPGQDSKELFHRTEPLYLGLSLAGFLVLFAFSGTIAKGWLQLSSVGREEAGHFIGLIGAIAAVRLACGLYRSVLIGLERQKALSLIDIGWTLARNLLVLPVLDIFGAQGYVYFCYQLGVSLLEVALLRTGAASLVALPGTTEATPPLPGVSIRAIFQSSFQIWVLSIIWVLTLQMDKLLLLRKLPLEELGYFSVVTTLTSGLLMLGAPIISAAMPRLVACQQAADWATFKATYLRASVLLASVATPLCLAMVVLPAHALYLLTNDASVSARYAPVLACYAFGGFMLLLSGSTFLLRYGAGSLGANIRMNGLYLGLLASAMAIGVENHGAHGAALAWLLVNVMQGTLIIMPLNRICAASVHVEWLKSVIAWPLLVSVPVFVLMAWLAPVLVTRPLSFLWLLGAALAFGVPMAWRIFTWRSGPP